MNNQLKEISFEFMELSKEIEDLSLLLWNKNKQLASIKKEYFDLKKKTQQKKLFN